MYTFDQTYLNPQTDAPVIKKSKSFSETIFELNKEFDESIYFNHHYTALRKLSVEKPISQTTIPFLMVKEFLFSYFEEKMITKEADKETITQILGHIKQFSSSHDLAFIRNFLDNIKTYAEIIGIKNTSDILVPALAKVVDEPLNVKIKFLENLLPFIDYLCSNGDEGINILKNNMLNILQELYSQKKEDYNEQMKKLLFKNFVKIAKNILPYDTNQSILYIIIGFGNEDNSRRHKGQNKIEDTKNSKIDEHKILCIRYIRNLAEGLGKENTERYLLPQLVSFTVEKNDDIKKELLITLPIIAEIVSVEFISNKVYDILRRIGNDLNPNLRKVCVIATAKVIKIFKNKCQEIKNINKNDKKYSAKNFVNLIEKFIKDKDNNVKYKVIEKIGEIIAPLDTDELSLELFEFYKNLSKKHFDRKKSQNPLGATLQEVGNPLFNKMKITGGTYSYLNDEDSSDFNEVNSMENDYNKQTTEKDLSYYFAYNFPAILFCYGKKYWNELKDIYYDFCFEEDLAIRLSIISSFHEIANIVGKDMTQNELLPIYDKFLESNDNYEQKLAIKNLPQILIKVDKKVKERYYKYFEPVSIFIDNTGNKVRNFNFLNWKNKLNVIEGILCYYNLYDNDIIYNSILPQCISFSLDKYYKVRKTSSKVLATLLLYLYQQNYKKDKLIQTIKNFAFHKKFKIRINFVKFLPVFLQDKDFYTKEIKNIIEIIVMKDKILDVKIALAKVFKKIINNEKEILYNDEDLNKFCFILNENKVINKIFEGIKISDIKDKIEDNVESKNYFVEDNKYFEDEFKLEFEKKDSNTNKNLKDKEDKEENKKGEKEGDKIDKAENKDINGENKVEAHDEQIVMKEKKEENEIHKEEKKEEDKEKEMEENKDLKDKEEKNEKEEKEKVSETEERKNKSDEENKVIINNKEENTENKEKFEENKDKEIEEEKKENDEKKEEQKENKNEKDEEEKENDEKNEEQIENKNEKEKERIENDEKSEEQKENKFEKDEEEKENDEKNEGQKENKNEKDEENDEKNEEQKENKTQKDEEKIENNEEENNKKEKNETKKVSEDEM